MIFIKGIFFTFILSLTFSPLTGFAQSDPSPQKTNEAGKEENTKTKTTNANKNTKTKIDVTNNSEKDEIQASPKRTQEQLKPPPGNPSKTDSRTNKVHSKNEKQEEVETLQVTGSYIRRSDIEGPSPILIFEREQIEKSGFNSVGGFLNRHTTVGPFGGSIKGIGRTLVLVNGNRPPGSGSSYGGGGASVNTIPLSAIERVEILTDGASALYGSDAIGGVVNIITRKNWDGVSVVAKTDITEYKGRDILRTSVAYGDSSPSGSFLTSLQYTHRTSLRQSDQKRIEFAANQYEYSTNYYVPRQGLRPKPGCTRFDSEGLCEDHLGPEIISNPSHGFDWVTDAEYDLNNITLYSTLYVGYGTGSSKGYSAVLSTPGERTGILLQPVPRGWNVPGLTPGQGGTLLYHRLTELPGTETKSEGLYLGLITGVRGDLGMGDWTWDFSLSNQFNQSISRYYNEALFAPVKSAIANGTYNPFGNPSENNTDGFIHNFMNRNRAQTNWLEFKATGFLGNFLGLDWSSAAGVSMAHFEYKDERDDRSINNEIMGTGGVEGSGARQLYAGFAELYGTLGRFEAQLTLREDIYSDFGDTLNPKVALRYQPLNWLALRGSWGTGFKAPDMQDVYGPKLEGFVGVVDRRRCESAKREGKSEQERRSLCRPNSYSAGQGANPNLKEETSQSFNFGVLSEPVKNLFLSLDYWEVTLENIVGSDIGGLMRLENIDPSAPARYGAAIKRNPNEDDRIERIEAFLQNVGKNESRGLDFKISYSFTDPLFDGRMTFNSQASYMFHYYRSFYKELGREQLVGRYGIPRWRNVSSLTYSLGRWSGTLTARSAAKVETSDRQEFIPSFTNYDFSLFFKPHWGGEFQLGSINVFAGQPRYDYSTDAKVDTSLYSAERAFFFAYRQDF